MTSLVLLFVAALARVPLPPDPDPVDDPEPADPEPADPEPADPEHTPLPIDRTQVLGLSLGATRQQIENRLGPAGDGISTGLFNRRGAKRDILLFLGCADRWSCLDDSPVVADLEGYELAAISVGGPSVATFAARHAGGLEGLLGQPRAVVEVTLAELGAPSVLVPATPPGAEPPPRVGGPVPGFLWAHHQREEVLAWMRGSERVYAVMCPDGTVCAVAMAGR